MRAYLIGFAASLALVVVASGASYLVTPARSASEIQWLVTLLLIFPVASAWLGAQIMHTLRPRRLFDPRVDRPELALMLGALGGALCAGGIALWRSFFEQTFADSVLVALMAIGATLLVVGLSPRARRGRCVRCNTALERLDLCHECGTPTTLRSIA